jgi:hypothetical protein
VIEKKCDEGARKGKSLSSPFSQKKTSKKSAFTEGKNLAHFYIFSAFFLL